MTQHMTRRAAFGAIASIPAAGAAVALPVALAAAETTLPKIRRDRLLYAYNEWLYMERRLLMRDIYGDNADICERSQWVPTNTLATHFHFPMRSTGLTWDTMPRPETRALAVMVTAGVDLTRREAYAL